MIGSERLDRAAEFIWGHGRVLELALFEFLFVEGDQDQVVRALGVYQLEDGGFGYALEPDLRAPDSQPLFVEFALRTLHLYGFRNVALADGACRFLEQFGDLEEGIPDLFPSSQHFPRADHWKNDSSLSPSWDRFTGLVGLLNWQEIDNQWLKKAVKRCSERLIDATLSDSHTILTAFTLVESLAEGAEKERLFQKLADDLSRANYYTAEAPVTTYSLTPLDFAPTPESYCGALFSDRQLEGHLKALEAGQQSDGGWSINWTPPVGSATNEWRAIKTVEALMTLRAYGRM